MKLLDKSVCLKDIFLDPYNPRFIEDSNEDQDALMSKILQTKASIELMNSMKADIKWVNKIVVLSKENFSSKQLQIKGVSNCEYLVVEGNNRLACLKSGKIDGFTESSKIPVLVAEKEQNELIDEFEAQLRITQGIANVMVVKEWSVISKARHLYKMYYDFKRRETNDKITPHEGYKKIADELGVSASEVRQSIIRYEFYEKINTVADRLIEDHWGYLEAFDKTKEIRRKFGMSSETNTFEDESEEGYYEEIYKEIPVVIKKAVYQGINTKQFRDIMGSNFNKKEGSLEILEFLQSITAPDGDFNFRQELEQKSNVSDKEKWAEDLNYIKEKIGLFPVASEWAEELKPKLIEIKLCMEKIVNILS